MKPIICEDEKQTIQIEKESTDIVKKNTDKQDLEEEGNEEDETLRPVHKVRTILNFSWVIQGFELRGLAEKRLCCSNFVILIIGRTQASICICFVIIGESATW